MKNEEQNPKEEEINLEQFQNSRAPLDEKAINQQDDQPEENTYTAEEVVFADGEGTTLDDELGEDQEDQSEDDQS